MNTLIVSFILFTLTIINGKIELSINNMKGVHEQMNESKAKVYQQLFEKYKEQSNLDPLTIKYIFETWKMTKEIHENMERMLNR